MQFKTICLVLSLCPVQIKCQYRSYPRHWKSNQQTPARPKTLGEQIKRHRLELRLRQKDVAVLIGISSVSLSSWERGITSPSRRWRKKILEFLECAPPPVRKTQRFNSCQLCGISAASNERCLFENVCQ
jgi:DNA-binding transcriptional regulator YiaG